MLKVKGGAGPIPIITPDESSLEYSSRYFYMEGRLRSGGISENIYITMYGDFDFTTEEKANKSTVNSYVIVTDNYGSASLSRMGSSLESMIDDPASLRKKWLSKDNDIIGTPANDKIDGYKGDDEIIGGAGKDKLTGGEGDDYLDGGGDKDILKGGKGLDTFVVRNSGSVVIKDFKEGEDLIKLRGTSLSDISIIHTGKHTYIENLDGYWIAKLRGSLILDDSVFA